MKSRLVRYKTDINSNYQRNNYSQKRMEGRLAYVLITKKKGWIKVVFLDTMEIVSLRTSEVEELDI